MTTLIEVPPKEAGVWAELEDRPFKIAIALFAIYSGVSGLFNFGVSNEIFSVAVKYSSVFNGVFILAGVATLLGVLLKRLNVEASGLFLISTSLFLRMLGTVAIAGWDSGAHNMLAVSTLFISASFVRIYAIFRLVWYLKLTRSGRH